ncbi:MAG: class I SAM-dependent methyltransferase [Thermoleophilaceae bacterium]
MTGAFPVAGAAAWHDVECASYDADLALWRELAAGREGPLLDLGAGTGRVALDLGARGHAVTAVDVDPELVAACDERARARSLPVTAVVGDARSLELGVRHPLAILPMQVAQLMGSDEGRRQMLEALLGVLLPGGLVAIALADPFEGIPAGDVLPPLPDVLEVDGWVLSSTPVAVRPLDGVVAIDRTRTSVSPTGELTEEPATIMLDSVDPRFMERQGAQAGYTVLAAGAVPETRDYVGSTVVMLEAPR